MDVDKELQDIKARLSAIESGMNQQRSIFSSYVWPFVIGFVVFLVVILVTTGIVHFIRTQ
ncbi:hypothetical protein [Paenibacillus lutrae]|uniref:Uncharacterized protein n=1 Tax=Paenibacillus lutrae TaxID=2078573 RepID=A0A7X3FMD3_9BACL|nr:hypothetical protein [Paenibacillus lutrae]MVP02295.1 hypothetical protein [Paenibacillus lutrae]